MMRPLADLPLRLKFLLLPLAAGLLMLALGALYVNDRRAEDGVVVLFVQFGALSPEPQYPCGFQAVSIPLG